MDIFDAGSLSALVAGKEFRQQEARMLVQVRWKNGGYDYVRDFMLDTLIEAGAVASFLRSSGWVTIGVDPLRTRTFNREYTGPERRSTASSGAT